jgi:hypothetical protein
MIVASIQEVVDTSELGLPRLLIYHCFDILMGACSFSYPGSQPHPTDSLWACNICSLQFRGSLGATVVHLINVHKTCDWICSCGIQVSEEDTEVLRRLFQHPSFDYTFHRWSWSVFRHFYANAPSCQQKELMEMANRLAIKVLQQLMRNATILHRHDLDSESITKSGFNFSKAFDGQFGLNPLPWDPCVFSPSLDSTTTPIVAEIGQLDGETPSKPQEENVFGHVNLDVKSITANKFEAGIDPTARLKRKGKKRGRKKNKKTFESEWVRRNQQGQPANQGKSNENQKIGSAVDAATSDPPTQTGEPSVTRGVGIGSKRRFEDIAAAFGLLGEPPRAFKRRRERQTTTTNWDGDASAKAFAKYRTQHGMYDLREKEKEEAEDIASAVSAEVDRLLQAQVEELAAKNEEDRRCAEEAVARK